MAPDIKENGIPAPGGFPPGAFHCTHQTKFMEDLPLEKSYPGKTPDKSAKPRIPREKSPMELKALTLLHTLREEGHKTLLVGGCVRDMLLGKTPKDFDIATSASADEVEAIFEKRKIRTIPTGKVFGVMNVDGGDGEFFEIATFRQDGAYTDGRRPDSVSRGTIQQDAERRDLTINAMYLSPTAEGSYRVIDPTGMGRDDIKTRTIRPVGDPLQRIQEDQLRMLRAIRFAGTVEGAVLDQELKEVIKDNATLIHNVSAERIFQETTRMVQHPSRVKMFELLEETGLLKEIFPEIAALRDCMQDPIHHPEGDVLTHTLQVMGQLPEKPSESLAWAALLHDVAKPHTREENPEGRVSHHGHAEIGAGVAVEILTRLKVPGKLSDEVEQLVSRHMKSHIYPEMSKSKRKRFIAAPTIQDDMLLHRADCLSNGRHAPHDTIMAEEIETLLEEGAALPPPLVNGGDILKLGLEPGPFVGTILKEIQEQQLEGTINSKDEAIILAQEIIRKNQTS